MKCSNHPTVNAIGECVKCHTLVCKKCQVIWEETTYCSRCIDEILGTEARIRLQQKAIQRTKTVPESEDVLQDEGVAVPSIQAIGPATKQGRLLKTAIALLIIGFLAFGFVMLMAAFYQDPASYIPAIIVSTVFLILPFLIPGVICLRKGIAQDSQITPAKGSIPKRWWLLPAVLGFVGGLVSWMKQKDVNRRKAVNMLTLGITATLVWIIPVSVLQFPVASAILNVNPTYIYFNDLQPGLRAFPSESFVVTNTGDGTLTGTLITDKDWLRIDPAKIEVAGDDKQKISVYVDTRELSYEFTDTGHINIATNGGDKQITVTLRMAIQPPPPPSPTTTGVIFEDDFSDSYSGWAIVENEKGEWAYENGEYSLFVTSPDTMISSWNVPLGQLSDFSVEVDVKKLSGGVYSTGGIIFRVSEEQGGNSFYYFGIRNTGSGTYFVAKNLHGSWAIIRDWTESSYIMIYSLTKRDNNRLKVACKGPQIEVYANGYKLDTIYDASLTRGYCGIAAESYTAPGAGLSHDAHYHFDNFRLYADK
jgi:hypothetical protein